MPNEMNPHDPRALWQAQEVERVTLTIEEIRRRSARFERRIHWRNMREYIAGAAVIVFFAPQLWHAHGWRLTPALLSIVGVLYVMFQLHRRAAPRRVPADAGIHASVQFHRLELERQRDALHTVWRWYLLPFVPGFAAAMAVKAMDAGIKPGLIITVVGFVLVYVVIWRLNEWAARNLDRKVQELKAMEDSHD
jgi:4-hydroxybenzoate polyprenyltransferase